MTQTHPRADWLGLIALLCLLTLVVSYPGEAAAQSARPHPTNQWTTMDTLLEVSWQIVHAMDWGQTLEIARHPQQWYERNPVLGRHPSVGQVHAYMSAWAVLHPVVSVLLPTQAELLGMTLHPRQLWQMVTLTVSTTAVVSNVHLGVHVKF